VQNVEWGILSPAKGSTTYGFLRLFICHTQIDVDNAFKGFCLKVCFESDFYQENWHYISKQGLFLKGFLDMI